MCAACSEINGDYHYRAINRARIDQAKLLLGNPEYKVYEIAPDGWALRTRLILPAFLRNMLDAVQASTAVKSKNLKRFVQNF